MKEDNGMAGLADRIARPARSRLVQSPRLDRSSGAIFKEALLLLVISSVLAPGALAQAPEKSPGMAYAGWVFDGLGYREVFAPQQAPTLYLLAGQPSALHAHETLLYYWALTRRYMADWQAMDEPLAGVLEISQAGHVVASLDPVPVSLVRPNGASSASPATLATGQEAEQQYARYNDLMAAYWQAMDEYADASAAYEAQMAEAMRQVGAGEKNVAVPTPPTEPGQPALLVTEPALAFVLSLPEGRYSLQLRAAGGAVVPGSEREVVVFGPRRQGLSYTVIPESQWTQPQQSLTPDDDLYLAGGAAFYLQPRVAQEYNDAFYRRLKDPQDDQGRHDQWTWVQQGLASDSLVLVRRPGEPDERIAVQPYWVVQEPGAALGYRILDYDPEGGSQGTPTFRACRLQVEPGAPLVSISLQDSQGQVVAGSERQVRSLAEQRRVWLYLPALIPLAAAVGLGARRRARRARSDW
jgi:hypothetical protein